MLTYYKTSKIYPHRKVIALRNINLTIEQGEMVYILGPTGSGKTTLLELAYRAQMPTFGQVTFMGKNLKHLLPAGVAAIRRQIGVIFQDYRLVPYRTSLENASLPLEVQGYSDKSIRTRLEGIFNWLALQNKRDLFPAELSGGEQQRVAIARAIASEPVLLLADEPTANLDKETANGIMNVLNTLNQRGMSIILATHNEELTRKNPGRIIKLCEGRVISEG
ncbi:MAG: Cell division ATP-binding protein FtsE [candidate division WS2 bacterium]|uniref:Cell division ATP-binding protein FtsE n=1 Tax=Psychracetigena formicireducens TaxID=2986056 RepID=A0A9E2BFH9_PSYF1|nr:Cell division ATP-binding protein FtsE [Candidatus Psychracetigena formicireducens]MBT9144572.1 Cell division ATP-binding protein FtsE [Candidatus Psychracetigena formicireducens]MBT9150100.1 Cell division ATP-binding protein FtsE [Candidatus Psychracetigena formicireducens]